LLDINQFLFTLFSHAFVIAYSSYVSKFPEDLNP
jgi:hypothetical protein